MAILVKVLREGLRSARVGCGFDMVIDKELKGRTVVKVFARV